MEFSTIRKTAQNTGLPEYVLRRMLKAGQLPGFYSGSRFYVNRVKLSELLESDSLRVPRSCGVEGGYNG